MAGTPRTIDYLLGTTFLGGANSISPLSMDDLVQTLAVRSWTSVSQYSSVAQAIASGASLILVPDGTYTVNAQVDLNVAGQMIWLMPGATVQAAAGFNDAVFHVSAAGVTITGGGTIDGNRANVTDSSGIAIGSATDTTIDGVIIQHCVSYGVYGNNCDRSKIINNRLTDTGNTALFFETTGSATALDDLVIDDNRIDRSAETAATIVGGGIVVHATAASSALHRTKIRGNRLWMPASPGTANVVIEVEFENHHTDISNNAVNGGGIGISLDSGQSGVVGLNTVNGPNAIGIEFAGCIRSTMIGNGIDGNAVCGSCISVNDNNGSGVNDANTLVGNNVQNGLVTSVRTVNIYKANSCTLSGNTFRHNSNGNQVVYFTQCNNVSVSGGIVDAANASAAAGITIEGSAAHYAINGVLFKDCPGGAINLFADTGTTIDSVTPLGCVLSNAGSLVVRGGAGTFTNIGDGTTGTAQTTAAVLGATTPAGVELFGWNLVRTDTFGTAGSVPDHATLHQLYLEGQYYDTNPDGTQLHNPINGQQQTYQSFENAIVFSTDHLTIQGRGQPDSTIHSAQISSRWADRSFVFEVQFKAPNTAGTWVEVWAYPFISSDASELDVEIVQSASGGPENVNEAFFANHGDTATRLVVPDPTNFQAEWMRWIKAGFDATQLHSYTIYYDDDVGEIRRYLDGIPLYSAKWKWMQSLGGTGNGSDASFTIDLAIGGSWPGNVSDLTTWTGDLDIYSVSYYTKRSAPPVTQAWNQGHKAGTLELSDDYLTVTKRLLDGQSGTIYAAHSVSSGKWYWEVICSGPIGNVGVGLGTLLSSTWPNDKYLGMDADTLSWYGSSGGQVVTNATVPSAWGAWDSSTTSVRLCLALDADNNKIWGRVGTTGNWCNDVIANQDPANNIGGTALPTALQGVVVPGANLKGLTDSVIGVFSGVAGTPPAGFSTFS